MHMISPLEESNDEAPHCISSDKNSTLERLNYDEEQDDQPQQQHADTDSSNNKSNESLDSRLKRASTNIDKLIPEHYYKPQSQMQNDVKRCEKSDPTTTTTAATAAAAQTQRRRLHPVNGRQQSDFSSRQRSVNTNRRPLPLSSGTRPEHRNNSFELKQSAIYDMQTNVINDNVNSGMPGQTSSSVSHQSQVDERWNSQQNFWLRLASQASAPNTSHKELIKRSTFLVMSSMTVFACVLWGMLYIALSDPRAAIFPFIYSTFISLILFTCIFKNYGKGYDSFVDCQLTLVLMLPVAVHVSQGGLERSGGVMLWSFMCPIGAAFYRTAKESVRWFWLYISISGILLVREFWNVDNSPGNSSSISSTGSSSLPSQGTIQKLYFLMNIMGVKCVIFYAVFLFACELEKEYTKSEEVLSNILPSSIVKRVKRGELPIVDHVAGVTILFADLVGFTKASAEHHPNFLIGLFLRDIFLEFDDLVYKHGLEKIKTIGDAYMVVGGLDHGEEVSWQSQSRSAQYKRQKPHATNIMLLSVDMIEALEKVNEKYNLKFDLRIGVHTGPVVAGVLGLKRLVYDVWGDAVNTASRMESNGVPGLIHISSEMYDCVDGMTNIFDYTCCGKMDIKGKGEMITYLAAPKRDGTPGS